MMPRLKSTLDKLQYGHTVKNLKMVNSFKKLYTDTDDDIPLLFC